MKNDIGVTAGSTPEPIIMPGNVEQRETTIGKKIPTTLHLLIVTTISIFAAEAAITVFLAAFPPLPFYKQGILDATLVTILLFPTIYVFLYKPLVLALFVSRRTETEARSALAELGKRTRDLHRFRMGIEHSTEAIFMTDIDGAITYVNPAFEQIYGYTRQEAAGKTPRMLKSGLFSRDVYQQFWENLLMHKAVSGEMINKTKDGRLITVEATNTSIVDDTGAILGFMGVHRDISDKKKAEAEREKLVSDLQSALAEVKTLGGLIPICSSCKKIRDDKGYWNILEAYLVEHTDASFSHGVCPECAHILYPEYFNAQSEIIDRGRTTES